MGGRLWLACCSSKGSAGAAAIMGQALAICAAQGHG